jgi:hypothetical protein
MLRLCVFLAYLAATVILALLFFTTVVDSSFLYISLACVALGLALSNLPNTIVVTAQSPPQ